MDFSTSPSSDSSCMYKLFVVNLLGDESRIQFYCPPSVPSAIAIYPEGHPKENGKLQMFLHRIENDVTARLRLKIDGIP